MDWRITKDDYDRKLKEMKEKQHDINLQLEEHTRADENYHITAATVLNLARNALRIFESSEVHEKNALLNYLLQNAVLDGKKLTFELKKPFDSLLKLAQAKTENRALSPVLPVWGAVVEEVRTVFARLNDATIYIPDLRAKELT